MHNAAATAKYKIIKINQDLPVFDGLVAGVDEAGRGPLVGNVVAAAVILDPARPISGLNDSKKLSAAKREALAIEIKIHAHAWSVISVTPDDIDRLNILHATMYAMKQAIEVLATTPDHVFIDGNRCPELNMSATAVIKGDARVEAISAASILAKVERDAQMTQLHQQYPQYGFDQHKGYPTKAHMQALEEFGVCPQHRRSYGPVRRVLELVG